MVSCVFRENYSDRRVYNFYGGEDNDVLFCNIYGGSKRTECEFESCRDFVATIHKFVGI